MSTKKKDNGLTHKLSKEICSLTLAHAYVIVVRREKLRLRVVSFNGVDHHPSSDEQDPLRINVCVVAGLIQRAWVG